MILFKIRYTKIIIIETIKKSFLIQYYNTLTKDVLISSSSCGKKKKTYGNEWASMFKKEPSSLPPLLFESMDAWHLSIISSSPSSNGNRSDHCLICANDVIFLVWVNAVMF